MHNRKGGGGTNGTGHSLDLCIVGIQSKNLYWKITLGEEHKIKGFHRVGAGHPLATVDITHQNTFFKHASTMRD